MFSDGKLWIANSVSGERQYLRPEMANRHGLIAGATGTGKTITLKVMAESFSDAGVPVFLADVKGDLAGMIAAGEDNANMQERIARFGIDGWSYKSYPTAFWDIFGQDGHCIRTTVSEMGPILLARILGLNDTQTGILNIAFRVADENSLLLIDLKDLKAMLQYVAANARELSLTYGNITSQSVSAIIRSLLSLEDQGGNIFFGEPEFDVHDWMVNGADGRGMINVLHCEQLFQSPALYSTFLLWLLAELFEIMPEAGDCDKPKLVFFFDEAHLLFEDAPKVFLQKVEQVVRLIRSKGVGVYFITQSPTDLPDDILAQLGNRVQHALRAYTPAEQKKVRAAADTFRPNPEFKTMDVIMEMGTGEALVSCLTEDGSPGIVQRAFILPPQSRMGRISDAERRDAIASSSMGAKYDKAVDRESAYEILTEQAEAEEAERIAEEERAAEEKAAAAERKQKAAKTKKATSKVQRIATTAASSATRSIISSTIRRSVSKKQSIGERAINSAFNSTVNGIGRELSSSLVRGLFGTIIKG